MCYQLVASFFDNILRLAIITYSGYNQCRFHIDGSIQDCVNSIAKAPELMQSFTKPSIWGRRMLHSLGPVFIFQISFYYEFNNCDHDTYPFEHIGL